MSKVISFRLDDANLREARALEVIIAWTEQGHNLRFILTKALLELGHPGSDFAMNQDGQALNVVLELIDQVIEMVKTMQPDRPPRQDPNIASPTLSASFLASVKHRAKPGLKSSE
jgi:hypothetical protein